MPKIVFWNVQGSGGNTNTQAGDTLLGDLSEVTMDRKPDLVVLCELKMGFQNIFSGLGREYATVILPDDYPKKTTYRFGAFVRSSGGCVISRTSRPRLINDGNNRPALSIVVEYDIGLLAVHAPSSGPKNISAKMEHVQNTVQKCHGKREPCFIFGDFNMDLLGDRQKIVERLRQAGLSNYAPLPTQHRHTKKTHDLGKALDWALVNRDYEFRTSYEVITTNAKSDHRPILISWH